MKCYSYVRVSGKSQIDGDGFPRQRAAIDAWAAVNGYALVEEFEEKGVGGDNEWEQRPTFSDMVGKILDNGVRTIVVENLTRLARSVVVQEHILIWLASKGIALYSADTGENVVEAIQGDPMRKAMIQLQAVMSEWEKNSLVRKLRAARQRKQEGDPNWSQGRKKFGFRDGEKATLARMNQLRNSKLSFAKIAKALDEEGRSSRTGKPWSAETIRQILARKEKKS